MSVFGTKRTQPVSLTVSVLEGKADIAAALRRRTKVGQRSLRTIAAELAKLGYINERNAMFSAAAISSMLASSK